MKKIRLFEILFLIFATWYFMPIANGMFPNDRWKLVFFACYLGATLILFISKHSENPLLRNGKKHEGNVLIPIVGYMIVFTILYILNVKDANAHIRISFTFWGMYLFYYLAGKNIQSRNRIARCLIFMYVVTYITTLFAVSTDISVVRALSHAATDDTIRTEYLLRNIGDIFLVQTSVLIVPLAFYTAAYKKNATQRWKTLSVIFLIVELYFLLSASLSIALLLYFTAILLSILLCSKNALFKCIILLILLVCIMFVNFEGIFSYLANNIENEFIQEKFSSLASMFSGEGADGDVALRIDLYKSSWYTFIQNPFGVGPNYSYEIFDEGIGCHSQLLDDLARYGVFGLLFYIMLIRNYYKLLKEKYKRIGQDVIVLPIVILYVAMMILNLAFRSSFEGLFVFYIVPAYADILYEKSVKAENET